MSGTNGNAPAEIDVDPAVFQKFADLEKEFAKVELDALRHKEYNLRNLYTKRNVLCSQIPMFWPTVLMNGPQEFQSVLSDTDVESLSAIKSVNIERYQIKSGTEGEPRSLRFTFEFEQNDWFEDKKIVKEFQYVKHEDEDVGALVSKPVGFKWKKKGKKGNSGVLDLAVDLYKAEEAVRLTDGKTGVDLDYVDREGLWQYEKLREKLEQAENEDVTPTWLDWFGYRGPVGKRTSEKDKEDKGNAAQSTSVEEDMDGMLDVEIFPPGEEIAIALAEDLWPNVMDYFIASNQDPDSFDDEFDGLDSDEASEQDDEAPELVEAVEIVEAPPAKRQKRA